MAFFIPGTLVTDVLGPLVTVTRPFVVEAFLVPVLVEADQPCTLLEPFGLTPLDPDAVHFGALQP